MSNSTARGRVVAGFLRGLAVMGLLGFITATGSVPAGALDLGAPGRAVNKLLGRESAPAVDGARADGPGQAMDGARANGPGQGADGARSNGPGQAADGARMNRLGQARGASSQAPGADPAGENLSAADSVMVDEILLSPEPYVYRSSGLRDPFVSLMVELGDDDGSAADELHVRGILWGEHDRFALVETARGTSKILREGDHLNSFTVTRIEPDAVVVFTSAFGTGRTQRLPLVEWKGSQNARGER